MSSLFGLIDGTLRAFASISIKNKKKDLHTFNNIVGMKCLLAELLFLQAF